MATGYELIEKEVAELNFLLRNPASPKTIRAHYQKLKPLYKIWFDDIKDDKIVSAIIDQTGATELLSYKPPEVIELLSGRIRGFDKDLIVLMKIKAIKDQVGIEHEKICQLFAKNVGAPNKVKEDV